MKTAYHIHGSYLLITILAFVAGSQLVERPGSANALPDENSRQVRASATPTGRGQLKRSGFAQEGLEATEGHRPTHPASSAEENRASAGISPRHKRISQVDGPLAADQLEALVLTSIKSPDPLVRRSAFDRLLQEMELETFTVERSTAIRRAMFENGAAPEQWRLFDYALGRMAPEIAITLIAEIPEKFRDAYLGNILPGIASAAPQTAIDLFSGLGPDQQANLRNRLYEGLIDNDLATATEHIFSSTDTGNYDWRPMDVMTREIVNDRGLAPALEWAADLPHGPLRGNAWSAAYAHWATTEPHAAIQSIVDMPESPDRNQAINGFISAHAHADGETATIWAAEITQPGMREEAMVRAARQFYRQDPGAASQWFEDSGLPQNRWPQVTSSK